jgi:membrane-bound ClpP family serine protease
MSTLGVILVVVGTALMVVEAHLPSHGVLATGAVAALTAGVVLALSLKHITEPTRQEAIS